MERYVLYAYARPLMWHQCTGSLSDWLVAGRAISAFTEKAREHDWAGFK